LSHIPASKLYYADGYGVLGGERVNSGAELRIVFVKMEK